MVKKPDSLISVAQAAKMIGVQPRQVRNMIAKKLLPAESIGGSYVVRLGDVAKVPKERKPGPKPKS